MQTPNHLLRQSELVSLSILPTPVTVIGAGAIGSFTVLNLAKMGFSDITVWDFDSVDEVNLSSQFYRRSDIGKPKVEALRDLVRDFTGTEIKAVNQKYESGVFNGVVISAVDSMAVRKTIWENHYLKSFGTRIVIDPRMSAEFAALYCANPLSADDHARYSKTLHSDENSVQERCTAKATMYTVGMISGFVSRVMRDVLSDKTYVNSVQWAIPQDDLMVYRSDGTNNVMQPEPKPHGIYAQAVQEIPF